MTPNGSLNVTGIGTFQSPEVAAKAVLGLDDPDLAWDEWRVESTGDAAPRAAANAQRLGEQPSLNHLRLAAWGETTRYPPPLASTAASKRAASTQKIQTLFIDGDHPLRTGRHRV